MAQTGVPLHSPTLAAGQGQVRRPAGVSVAVGLMWVEALLSLLAIPGIWVYRLDLVTEVRDRVRRSGRYVPPEVMGRLFLVIVACIVLASVCAVALWLWMAWANGKGRYFGRVTVTFLLLLGLATYVVGTARGWPSTGRTLTLSALAVNAVVVGALYLPSSLRFYRQMAVRRGYR